MAKVCPLFSSSKGNSICISSQGSAVLVDAGAGAKSVEDALKFCGFSAENLRGILITHEHSDHINGLRVLLKRHKIPVYGTRGTIDFLARNGHLDWAGEVHIAEDGPFETDGLSVSAFKTSHDGLAPCGFIADTGQAKIGIATDLGIMTEEVHNALAGCKMVVLESNYDEDMLIYGNYPQFLKMRILSKTGHLSNTDCSEELNRLIENGTTHILLAHLSPENNTPQAAFKRALEKITSAGKIIGRDYLMDVATQRPTGKIITF